MPRRTHKSDVRPRRPKKKGPTKDPNDIKAWLVETITKWLLDYPGILVEHDRMVRTTDGESERQIDVLIRPAGDSERTTWTVAECKNYGRRIEVGEIDAFVGALTDIGVPPERGFVVAVKEYGYTREAKRRAKRAGIAALELTGIETVKRLTAQVYDAMQSVVFLVADIQRITLQNAVAEPIGAIDEALTIHSERGTLAVPDIIWHAWRTGTFGDKLGQYVFGLHVPEASYSIIKGEHVAIDAMGVVVNVVGYVQTIKGSANEHSLIDAAAGQTYRYGLKVNFPSPNGEYTLTQVDDETRLQDLLSSGPTVQVTHRVQVPRVRFLEALYWPPSERVYAILKDRYDRMASGEHFPPLVFAQVEGPRLNVAWEPIAAAYHENMRPGQESENKATIGIDIWWTDGIEKPDPQSQEQAPPAPPDQS